MSSLYWWCRFKCSNQHPINSGIPHLTLLISKIFLLDIHRLKPHLGVSLHPESSSIQSQVLFFSPSLSFEFLLSKMPVTSSSTDSIDRAIDNIMRIVVTGPILAVLVMLVEKVQLRTILLGPLGFLLKSSKSNLGELLALKLASRPVSPHLTRQTRRRLSLVVQQAFIPRRMNKDLVILNLGTKFRTSLTLGCPFVKSGVVILILEQASMKLISQVALDFH